MIVGPSSAPPCAAVAAAVEDELGTVAERRLDLALDPLARGDGDQRADVGRRVGAVADA